MASITDVEATALRKLLNEKETNCEMQYEIARANVAASLESDRYWEDNIASFVAAVNVKRAAESAIELIALRKKLLRRPRR